MVKNLPAMQETWVGPLVWEDPGEEGVATHSRRAWQATVHGGVQGVRHDWATCTFHQIG